ncbi:MAG: hydrolase [Oscillospiraceae bacterium]|nr:hydrolase [Oscillospiraceae bacterium]
MRTTISTDEALAIVGKYNKESFHIRHAITVSQVMRYLANELGYGDEAEYWATCGMLHDVDFEQYPDCHLDNTPAILKSEGISDDVIHTVMSHGYSICSDVEPEHEMEKVLFATDELTGLVYAAAKMRPSKSCTDMELSSLKKKYKDKKFAAGCSRDVIAKGAAMLGWDLDKLLQTTLDAMKATEANVNDSVERYFALKTY